MKIRFSLTAIAVGATIIAGVATGWRLEDWILPAFFVATVWGWENL